MKQVMHFAMVKLTTEEHCSAAECEEATDKVEAGNTLCNGSTVKLKSTAVLQVVRRPHPAHWLLLQLAPDSTGSLLQDHNLP